MSAEQKNKKELNRKNKRSAAIIFMALAVSAALWFSVLNNKTGFDTFTAGTVRSPSSTDGRCSDGFVKLSYSSSKELSDRELEKVAFCKEIYYEYMSGYSSLNVDYSSDSLRTIAQKLQDAGWEFLPDDKWDLSKASVEIPAMDGILDNALLLNAVYFLADNKACHIRIVESKRNGDRDIDIKGGADTSGLMFSGKNGDIDQQINRWLSDAGMAQEQALYGFCPFLVGKILNRKTFSDLKISQERFRDLRRITKEHSTYDILQWDGGKWKVYTSSVYNDLDSDNAGPDDLSSLAITYLSKKITFYGDSEGNIDRFNIKIEKNSAAGTEFDPDAEFQKYSDQLKKTRGQRIDLSDVYTYEGYELVFHENISSVNLDRNGDVTLSLTGELASKYGKNYLLDTNVLKMYTVHIGNGSYGQLLFIKEDGTVDALIYDSIYISDSDTLELETRLAPSGRVVDIVSIWGMPYAFDVEGKDIDISGDILEAREDYRNRR